MERNYNFKAPSAMDSFLPIKSRDIFIIASILQVVMKGETKQALQLALEWLKQQSPDLWAFRGYLEQVKEKRELTQMDMFGSSTAKPPIIVESNIDNPFYQEGYLQGLKDASMSIYCAETIQPGSLRYP